MNSTRTLVIIALVGLALAASAIMFLKPGANSNSHVTEVTVSNFEDEVLNSKTPVVIDFNADWCGPCQQYSPIFEKVSGDYKGKVKFVSIDIDDSPELAAMFGIQALPTTMVIRPEADGTYSLGGIPGALTEQGLRQILTIATDPATKLVPANFEKDASGKFSLKPILPDPVPDTNPDVKDDPAGK